MQQKILQIEEAIIFYKPKLTIIVEVSLNIASFLGLSYAVFS